MSESLKDILNRRSKSEPYEISVVKEFVKRRFNEDVNVSLTKTQIIINTRSSALAGTLRLNIFELQNTLKSDKKLIIRTAQ